MNKAEYFALAEDLGREAGATNGPHQLFVAQRERLWATMSHFNLQELKGKSVLEIGSFYSYTPFVLRQNGNAVTVIEGDDPITYPLKPVYARNGIEYLFADLVALFEGPDVTKHRLPFPENHFDAITCWETMEHFNFNPVGFVKELHRILKPGGIAMLTVPNRAKLDHRVKMIIGRPMGEPIDSYYTFYGGTGRFFGWHWREYTLPEFTELFSRAQFHIQSAEYITVFQNRTNMSVARRAARLMMKGVAKVVPSCGSICALVVRK
jgi:SAM-dependent methyltransferase